MSLEVYLRAWIVTPFRGIFSIINVLARSRSNQLRILSLRDQLRACLHEGGGPQVGEVTCGRLPHLTCKRDHIKIRDCMDRRNVYMFKRKQWWTTAYQHVISRASHISVSIKGTFWYLSLFFLEWSTINFCYSSRFVSLGFTIRTVRTQKKNSLRFLFFLPLSSYCNQIY